MDDWDLPQPLVATRSTKFDWCRHHELRVESIYSMEDTRVKVECCRCDSYCYYNAIDLDTTAQPALASLAILTNDPEPISRMLFDHAMEKTRVPAARYARR